MTEEYERRRAGDHEAEAWFSPSPDGPGTPTAEPGSSNDPAWGWPTDPAPVAPSAWTPPPAPDRHLGNAPYGPGDQLLQPPFVPSPGPAPAATMPTGPIPTGPAAPAPAPGVPWWQPPTPGEGDPWASMAVPAEPVARTGRSLGLPLVILLIVGALLAGVTGGALGYGLAANRDDTLGLDVSAERSGTPVDRPAGSVAAVAARILPAVVSISVTSAGGNGVGSGFVIRSDGYILTNNHVVASAASQGRISVKFTDKEGAETAQIVGRSSRYDLAVLRVDRRRLPEMELGNSDEVQVGDQVIAIGSPLRLAGTVTSGIISAKNRPVTAGESGSSEQAYINAIQTDAAINPGNSGGPLVDALGRVIGVNSAIATVPNSLASQGGSIGLGFAITINQAKRTAEQLIRDGRATYPVIGVNLDPTFTGAGVRINPATAASPDGGVQDGGPSDAAGLQAGDIITRFGDTPVSSPEELIVAIIARRGGDEVPVRYLRGTRESTTTVRLGESSE